MNNENIILNVLIACEESQVITKAFRKLGHNAYSCDIQECSGGMPQYHIKNDVTPLINGDCTFTTMDGKEHIKNGAWDIIIAHPECKYICLSNYWLYNRARFGNQYVNDRLAKKQSAIDFFLMFTKTNCKHVAIENPVGWMNTHYRKPDCIFNPYDFGDPYSKRTCLWLFGLPKLQPTNILTRPAEGWKNQYKKDDGSWGELPRDANGKILRWTDPQITKIRARTYDGVGAAIADQFSKYVVAEKMGLL